jgi:hypothetical protein
VGWWNTTSFALNHTAANNGGNDRMYNWATAANHWPMTNTQKCDAPFAKHFVIAAVLSVRLPSFTPPTRGIQDDADQHCRPQANATQQQYGGQQADNIHLCMMRISDCSSSLLDKWE